MLRKPISAKVKVTSPVYAGIHGEPRSSPAASHLTFRASTPNMLKTE